MNILFFLTPKSEVAFIENTFTLRQILEKMEIHRYSAIPILSGNGEYVGTITEGDFLRLVLHYPKETLEQLTVGQVELRVHHRSVNIDARMEDMVDLVTVQNFVPVVDGRGIFCGIVTRRDVITYLCKQVQS